MALNIFNLPLPLLENIVLRTLSSDPRIHSPVADEAEKTKHPRTNSTLGMGSSALGCALCAVSSFADVAEQRAHYRSDWHRYNVKAKLVNKPLLGEKDFMDAIADLSDSISGSESTDSDGDTESESGDLVRNALNRAQRHTTGQPESPAGQISPTNVPKSPIQWFHSPPSTQIGIYTAIFPFGIEPQNYVPELTAMQASSVKNANMNLHEENRGRLWSMFMIAGGHFAGMVVQVSNPQGQNTKIKGKHKHSEYEVLVHKTFHRYTTRRKQGGSQSVNDNAKGPAKSAGAQLRRYGEQALRDDIRNLLSEWNADIAASERIWIRANVANKRIFYDYDNAPFSKNDERLRSFPFPTRRPTHTELLRCLNELIRAKVTHFTKAELKEQDELYLASLPKPKSAPSKPAPQVPKEKAESSRRTLTKEQQEQQEHWRRLLEMARKGRTEALSSLWERVGASLGGIDAHIPAHNGPEDEGGWTLLHVAAAAGQESTVLWLLQDQNANPTLKIRSAGDANGELATRTNADIGKTPYEVASSKSTRDVFRRLAGLHPDKWDWLGEGRVPSILSKEMEEGQDEKKKARRKGLKDKMKERETKRPTEEISEPDPKPLEDAMPASSSGPQKLGGVSDAGSTMGLTPEMKARIERERRARAIEARMQRG